MQNNTRSLSNSELLDMMKIFNGVYISSENDDLDKVSQDTSPKKKNLVENLFSYLSKKLNIGMN